MLPILEYATTEADTRLRQIKNRSTDLPKDMEAKVKEILQDVRNRGDEAILYWGRQFDAPSISLANLMVHEKEIQQAYSEVSQEFLQSLRKAISNIQEFHKHQTQNSWFMTREDGAVMGQMVRPVDSAGIYAPGGKAGTTPLISTVLMCAIPANIAGVSNIVLASPPKKDATLDAHLLVAAKECGVTRIYKMGSAWAIAAMAFGTATIEPVDVIVGPGNIYVALAKKMIAGMVGIDMVAGPSEILIIADESADASFVAADLLSQAEHDPMASSVLITTSLSLAEAVQKELEKQLNDLTRKDIAMQSIFKNGLLLLVKDLHTAADISNHMAPEHLEILTYDPWSILPHLKHAGSIFLGPWTPEAAADYIAGPNHVLPTMGTARFSSGLGVTTFLKRSNILSYTQQAMEKDAQDILRLATAEGLDAHARSALQRVKTLQ
ncbi:MAG: histidinol dehydrogenase [Dissulfuribacterales bacterium]